jgi:hypothetical protein
MGEAVQALPEEVQPAVTEYLAEMEEEYGVGHG